MTYQVIDDFAAGLDTRKSPLTSAPGTLTRLVNAAITPGGEIAKRRAFVKVGTVSNTTTFGFASTESRLWIYGRNVEVTPPVLGVPGVILTCQSIPNTDPTLEQTDFDIYNGLVYLTCRTGSGVALPYPVTEANNPHYYNSNLTEGSGKGFYIRTYQYKMYTVLGQSMYFSALNNPVAWDDEAYIDAVVVSKVDKTNPVIVSVPTAEIGQFVAGKTVLMAGITTTGLTQCNGFSTIGTVVVGGGGTSTFTLIGRNGTTATVADTNDKITATPAIRILGISNTDPARCSVALADIGKFTEGQKIFIQLVTGSMISGNFVVTDISTVDNTFALLNVHAAGYPAPQTADTWATVTSDVVRLGRGSVNVASVDSDAESLQSLEVYYDKMAIFSTKAAQIWNIDADAAQNAIDQILRGAGTTAPRSPLMYGSGDVLYLDRSGIRSLRAKDSSNSAAVSDIGSPVDPVIQEYRRLHVADPTWMNKAISLLEPDVGRFWVVFPDRVLVLSYFPGPKVTAWSEYVLKELIDEGVTVKHAVTCGGRIFFRDTAGGIWVYGGANGITYNNCGVEVRLPYLDGKKPGHKKIFEAVDATVNGPTSATPAPTGLWEIRISYNYNSPDVEEVVGSVDVPTWNMGRGELQGYDSHYSVRFYNSDALPATISNIAVHYSLADDEA